MPGHNRILLELAWAQAGKAGAILIRRWGHRPGSTPFLAVDIQYMVQPGPSVSLDQL